MGRIHSRLASIYGAAGLNTEADSASQEAIQTLESLPPGPDLAEAYRVEAHLRILNRDTQDAVTWGERSIELARQFGEQSTLIGAKQAMGAALAISGDRAGIQHVERALELALETGNDEMASLAYRLLGSGLGELYSFDQAIPWLEECIRFSSARDNDLHHWYAQAWLALSLVYRGGLEPGWRHCA